MFDERGRKEKNDIEGGEEEEEEEIQSTLD